MLYYDDILTKKDLEELFTPEFIEKLKNKQSGLVIKPMKGHSNLYSARFNGNERVLCTIEIHQGRRQLILLARLFHKEYEHELKKHKNKKLLTILKNKGVNCELLKLGDTTSFDEQFEDFTDPNEEQAIYQLFKVPTHSPAHWAHDHFIVFSDAQQKAIDLKHNNFIIGPPGSGKTEDLKMMCKDACQKQALLLGDGETKTNDEILHIFLSPQASLATRIKPDLPSYPWLKILGLEAFAKEIDPSLKEIEPKGIEDFIEWCHLKKIDIKNYFETCKKMPDLDDLNDSYAILYEQFQNITGFRTKTQYLKAPFQCTLVPTEFRESVFNLYVQYCQENLIGSYIPEDNTPAAHQALGAKRRAEATGITFGYDCKFYDFAPAIEQYQGIHTLYLDEIQNFPRRLIAALSSKQVHIQAAGDSNQGLYDLVSNLEFIRQAFKLNHIELQEHLFELSYRSSKMVTMLLNRLLDLQYDSCARIAIDLKTANHTIQIDPNQENGEVEYCKVTESEQKTRLETCKALCHDSDYLVIAPKSQIEQLKKDLGTQLVFCKDTVGGLEAKHVIIWDLLTTLSKMLKNSIQAKKQVKTSASKKDKLNTQGQEMILEFHRLYVALSRAITSLKVYYHESEEHLIDYFRRSEPIQIETTLKIPLVVPLSIHLPTVAPPIKSEEQLRQGWITRCNQFLAEAQAYAEVHHKKKERVCLDKVKNILKEKQLNCKELELPENYTIPKGYECLIPPASPKLVIAKQKPTNEQLSFIKILLKDFDLIEDFNENNLRQLFNCDAIELETILFSPITDNNESAVSLWEHIFKDSNKTLEFLNIATINKTNTDKMLFLHIKFTPQETECGLHYFTMLMANILWTTDKQYININNLVKNLIYFVTLISPKDITEEIYYAMAQHHLAEQYKKLDPALFQKKATMLYSLSQGIINHESLTKAIAHGNTEDVRILTQCISNDEINKLNESGYTPLMVACNYNIEDEVNIEDTIRILLTHTGIEINKENDTGESALIIAMTGEDSSIMAILVEHGANINQINKCRNMTPLMRAAFANNIPALTFLLNYPTIELNKMNSEHYTALDYAIESRSKEAVNMLKAAHDKSALRKFDLVKPKKNNAQESNFLLDLENNFNKANIKTLMCANENTLQVLLFLPSKFGETTIALWDYIFSNIPKTLLFLTTVTETSDHQSKLMSVFEQKHDRQQTEMSLHYYAIICLSKRWISANKQANAIAKKLIQMVIRVSFEQSGITEDIYYAIAQRSLEVLYRNGKDHLKLSLQINSLFQLSKNVLNSKTLILAVRNNDELTAQILTSLLTDNEINEPDENGYTALMVAAITGNTKMVTILLQGKIIKDSNPMISIPAILSYIQRENPQMIPNHLKGEMNIAKTNEKQNGNNALMMAVNAKHYSAVSFFVSYIIKHRIDIINQQNLLGDTALTIAAQVGGDGSITLLLQDPRIDVKRSNFAGQTALMIARSKNDKSNMQKLLKHKTNVHQPHQHSIADDKQLLKDGLNAYITRAMQDKYAPGANNALSIIMARFSMTEATQYKLIHDRLLPFYESLIERLDRGDESMDVAGDSYVVKLEAALNAYKAENSTKLRKKI